MEVKKDPQREKLDLSKFLEQSSNPEVKYGLPREIKFCYKCCISNQRPNSTIEFKHNKNSKKKTINFDSDNICDACRISEMKKSQIDWDKREYELNQLCNKFRSINGSYDCIVPGSGGKDSFYASWILKYKYNMNPLTITWAPNIYTDWGRKNFDSWIHSGMDNYLMTPSGKSKRLLTRLAVENLFHPFQPFILGQKCLAPKLAIQMKIPLIFYGENEAEYGNPINDNKEAKRSYDYFSSRSDEDLFIGGESLKSLKTNYGMLNSELNPYLPADVKPLESLKAEIHYLGYYLNWHPQSAYYFAVEHGGFKASPERTSGTYSKYISIDDKIDDFHYYTTFIKFGIGRATYDASQEVRSGDLERDEALALIERYDGEFPERWSEEIFKYLSINKEQYPKASKMFEQPIMDRDYFDHLTDQFRSPHLWKYIDKKWFLRKTVNSK